MSSIRGPQTEYSSSDQDEAPPVYSHVIPEALTLGTLTTNSADIAENGRIDIDVESRLGRTLASLVSRSPKDDASPQPPPYTETAPFEIKLNIVIQVVGSRGDVQPFVALGNELQKHGHRVRIATHRVFEDFVRNAGLEFYSIGGDPAELMAYMVKNPGLIPSVKTLRKGEIQKKRIMIAEMLEGCWQSCISSDTVTNAPFVADAIIANPPSFAHIHCAQALACPLHLMFTMPWTSTRAFPHPLVNLKSKDTDPRIANYISYGMVEFLTWQGLGDIINQWRRQTLKLAPVPIMEGPLLAESLKIPFTYCWSPALIPKPADWGSNIDVCGFFFRDPPQYTPPQELADFLKAGSSPIYIGFGSIVTENAKEISAMLLEAVKIIGVRAIISRGWSDLSGDEDESIFWVGDCPHEWLFQQVAAVIHHGGAGTTACGLLNGRPTAIIPFFGDQPFWGKMVAAAGAGPDPMPHKTLRVEQLVHAIQLCLTKDAIESAELISSTMTTETGVKAAVSSFHAHLPLAKLRCQIVRDRPASLKYKSWNREVNVSRLAASILISEGWAKEKDFELAETNSIVIENRRWDPVTAVTSAGIGIMTEMMDATAGIFIKPYEEFSRSRGLLVAPPSSQAGRSQSHEAATRTSESHAASHLEHLDLQSSATSSTIFGENTTSKASNSESNTLVTQSEYAQSMSSNKGSKTKAKLHKEHKYENNHDLKTAGAMFCASGKSLGNWFLVSTKGALVDMPLAATEGLRAVPTLYGEEPMDQGKVTDWKSGAIVGAKTFASGWYEGVTDMYNLPAKGAKEGGPIGAIAGVGKGILSFTTKPAAGTFGLFAYPSSGISQSIRNTYRTETRKSILKANYAEAEWILRNAGGGEVRHSAVLEAFEALKKGKKNVGLLHSRTL